MTAEAARAAVALDLHFVDGAVAVTVAVAGASLTPPALGRFERKRPRACGAGQAGLIDLED